MTAPGVTLADLGNTDPVGGLYVYGIVPPSAGANTLPPGICGAAVRSVGDGANLAALVSDLSGEQTALVVDEEPLADISRSRLADAVRAHETVLEAALDAGVVPLRFGSLVATSEALLGYLASHREELEAALGHVQGRAEWAVRLSWDRQAAAAAFGRLEGAEGAEVDPDEASGGSGRAYLVGRQRQRQLRAEMSRLRAEYASLLYRSLRHLAAAAVRRPLMGAAGSDSTRETILDSCFLLDRGEEAHFAEQLETELSRAKDVQLAGQMTGPWPPYHFVELQLGDRR